MRFIAVLNNKRLDWMADRQATFAAIRAIGFHEVFLPFLLGRPDAQEVSDEARDASLHVIVSVPCLVGVDGAPGLRNYNGVHSMPVEPTHHNAIPNFLAPEAQTLVEEQARKAATLADSVRLQLGPDFDGYPCAWKGPHAGRNSHY
jgi:hypothetical protein